MHFRDNDLFLLRVPTLVALVRSTIVESLLASSFNLPPETDIFPFQANNTGGARSEEATEIFLSGTIVRSSTPDEGGSIPGTPRVKPEPREDSATNLAEVDIFPLLY